MRIIKTIALAGLIAISMTSCCNNKADAVLENIFERRSVRKFTSEPVSDKQIEKLLRAAMAAPSAKNVQPWRFVVIRDKKILEEMAHKMPYARRVGLQQVLGARLFGCH